MTIKRAFLPFLKKENLTLQEIRMNLRKIAVIGAGTMGAGIAQWFMQQNIEVYLVDTNQDFLKSSGEKIFQNIDSLLQKNKITTDDAKSYKLKLHLSTLQNISKDVDMVIEAIIENLEVKRKLFLDLDQLVDQKTIFASNTSSLPITEIASILPEARKNKFIGIHFFNPATIMKLVEIINGVETDKTISPLLISFFNDRGKVAVLCNDRPGFIVNRVARNFYGESLRIIENYDLEKIKEVDRLLKEVGGFKMGAFELMDLIGIDINYSVTESVYQAFFHEPRFRPHKLQKEMVLANRLGRKTKRGFYEY
jgi:3-hydroxybutyryl-CoA dehydrogenase